MSMPKKPARKKAPAKKTPRRATAKNPPPKKRASATTARGTTRRPRPPSATAVEIALRAFLEAMDAVNDTNDSVTDTDVREILAGVVIERLVRKRPTRIPSRFQMMDDGEMSAKHDVVVRRAVTAFIKGVEASPEWRRAASDKERQALIARDDVTSRQGNAYWLYLGAWD